jgi:putative transcriptional regulator
MLKILDIVLKIYYILAMYVLTTQIKQRRLALEMTQEDLAERSGTVRQTIAYLERGEYMPSLGLAWKIARVLGVSLETLFTITEEPS